MADCTHVVAQKMAVAVYCLFQGDFRMLVDEKLICPQVGDEIFIEQHWLLGFGRSIAAKRAENL